MRACIALILALALAAAASAQNQRRNEGGLLGLGLVAGSLGPRHGDVIDITGNTSFTDEELYASISEQLREIHESGLTPARADDAAFYIGAFYRKNGFASVETDYEIRGRKLIVRVREGPRSLIERITFIGNRAFPSSKLDDYMIGDTLANLQKEPERFPYTAAEVAAGADRVRGFYLSEGFLNVTVDASDVRLSASGTRAVVTVRIVEGQRFTFGEIRFTGDTLFPREELLVALGDPETGAPAPRDRRARRRFASEDRFHDLAFSPARADAMRRNLQSFYRARGYFQAEVEMVADPTLSRDGRVPITFTAKPRGLFRFGGISVRNEGAAPRLSPQFLPRRFAPLTGEIYDPEKLDETYREMLRTGLFSTLRVSPSAIPGNLVRLEVTAEEARARELGFTLSYGSYEGGGAGFRIGDRNLFGSGRPLTFSFDYTQRSLRGELLYIDPWLFDTRFSLRSRLFAVQREELGYTKNAQGARVDIQRKVLPRLELGVFAQGSNVAITSIDTILLQNPQNLGPTNYTIASLGITQLTDFRDDPINPSRGFVLSSSFDYSLLDGAPGFTRSTVRFSWYQPIGRTLLGLGARAGYIARIAQDLPIDELFFNGGASSVRSFAERELGPKDNASNPLGGEFFTVFNAELQFPLYQALQGAVFVDAGSLRNDDVADSGEMRYAIGVGLRYKLPIGPLRLDYGLNPNPKTDEANGAFHFSFGFAF
jgi:outer membrane protein assembly factor BamA